MTYAAIALWVFSFLIFGFYYRKLKRERDDLRQKLVEAQPNHIGGKPI